MLACSANESGWRTRRWRRHPYRRTAAHRSNPLPFLDGPASCRFDRHRPALPPLAAQGYQCAEHRRGVMSWYREISAAERRTFWACFGGWALDALDLQMFGLVIPAIIATWHVSHTHAGLDRRRAGGGLRRRGRV